MPYCVGEGAGPYTKALRAPEPATAVYNAEHDGCRTTSWMQQSGFRCERDEYSPADVRERGDGQHWICLIPRADTGLLDLSICEVESALILQHVIP